MPDKKSAKPRRETLVEKLVRRSLETVGGSVDSVFGRGKKPDALPATSDLAERLRKMIDRQAQVNQDGRKLAPHLISLKYAWGQTSDEFEVALKRLKNELLIVAIDFINDNRFATLAPVKIATKADILTVGFTMSIGFDADSLRDAEQVEIPVEIYAKLLPDYQANLPPAPLSVAVNATATFPSGGTRTSTLRFVPEKKTTLTVGRIKEIDLYLDDDSVSKHHASLVMNAQGVLRVADIGSTNGTFLHGARVAYGKAYEIQPETKVGFGDVSVVFEWELPQQPEQQEPTPEILAAATLPTLDGNSATTKADEANESGVKIGVKSSPRSTPEDEAEPLTVFGAKTVANGDDELETLGGELNDEPETVNKEFASKSKVFSRRTSGELPHTTQTLTPDPEEAQTTADSPSQTVEHNDFTQSLDPDLLAEKVAEEDLVGFDSLLGKASDPALNSDEFEDGGGSSTPRTE